MTLPRTLTSPIGPLSHSRPSQKVRSREAARDGGDELFVLALQFVDDRHKLDDDGAQISAAVGDELVGQVEFRAGGEAVFVAIDHRKRKAWPRERIKNLNTGRAWWKRVKRR